MIKSGQLKSIAFATLAIALSAPVMAQNWPVRAVRIIVPYAPGGGADVAYRIIAQKLQENTGHPAIVENRPGASEIIGNDAIAKATPDGHTIGFISNSLGINAILQPKLPFDTERDIIPIMRTVAVPLVMVVSPSLGVNSVKELVAMAKAQPGKLNYATFGAGGPHGLAMEWFKSVTGTNIVAVPYKGVGPSLVALAAGEVHVMLTGLTGGQPHIKAGRIRAIGVTPAKGIAGAPEIPPIARDYPEYDITTWYGMGTTGGTPAPVVARIHAELLKVLNAPDVRERFEKLGVELSPSTQEELVAQIRAETQIWSRVIKTAGIKLN